MQIVLRRRYGRRKQLGIDATRYVYLSIVNLEDQIIFDLYSINISLCFYFLPISSFLFLSRSPFLFLFFLFFFSFSFSFPFLFFTFHFSRISDQIMTYHADFDCYSQQCLPTIIPSFSQKLPIRFCEVHPTTFAEHPSGSTYVPSKVM